MRTPKRFLTEKVYVADVPGDETGLPLTDGWDARGEFWWKTTLEAGRKDLTDQRPLLLLDVDGVLIPYGELDPAADWVTLDIEGLPKWARDTYRIREGLAEALAGILPLYDVRWWTSWAIHGLTEELEEALGWPPLYTISDTQKPHMSEDRERWKSRAWDVLRARYRDRPVAWVDDHLSAIAPRGLPGPHLLIEPASTEGLTPDDVGALERFAGAPGVVGERPRR